jgi:YidC/Oxa1 family membrane protein insertase
MPIFNTVLIYPLINIVLAIYHALTSFHIPGALGFSIILSTALIRLILYPFTASQLKFSKKMQEMQPHLNRAKQKYKDDPKRSQLEQMAIYKEFGVNPAAGCLPFIVQIVLLLGFYNAIFKVIALKPKETISVINKIAYFDFLKLHQAWNTNFFGIPLIKSPGDLIHSIGFIIILIPALTVLLQLIQSKMMVPAKPPLDPAAAKAKKNPADPDFSKLMQSQMLFMTPFIIGFVSYRFALGLSLYWNTFTIFGIIQQYQVAGLGGLSEWLNKIKWKK